MGSRTHCSKIDGFPATQGTHANGATDAKKFGNPSIEIDNDVSSSVIDNWRQGLVTSYKYRLHSKVERNWYTILTIKILFKNLHIPTFDKLMKRWYFLYHIDSISYFLGLKRNTILLFVFSKALAKSKEWEMITLWNILLIYIKFYVCQCLSLEFL